MENDSFGKSLIDTDAQVIILMNIIYVVTVGKSLLYSLEIEYLLYTYFVTSKFTVSMIRFNYAYSISIQAN